MSIQSWLPFPSNCPIVSLLPCIESGLILPRVLDRRLRRLCMRLLRRVLIVRRRCCIVCSWMCVSRIIRRVMTPRLLLACWVGLLRLVWRRRALPRLSSLRFPASLNSVSSSPIATCAEPPSLVVLSFGFSNVVWTGPFPVPEVIFSREIRSFSPIRCPSFGSLALGLCRKSILLKSIYFCL